ncbi:MAG: dehydrogenase [Nevskia sp.]|nr:dehydrogenase [Nevskia sp.]
MSVQATACDVVVIGGGHNGLVAANYLADSGLKVTVAEACPQVGGLTSTTANIPGAPKHLINNFSVDAFFWDSFAPSRELELDRHGLRRITIDPGHVYLHPSGGSIAFWADINRTVDEIRRFSEHDAQAYADFSRVLTKFADVFLSLAQMNPVSPDMKTLWQVGKEMFRSRGDLKELGTFPFASANEIIGERFKHPVVRDAMHACAGATVPNSQSGTGACFLWLATMHRYKCQRPVGGVQAIPDALANRLRSKGGTVLVGAPVAEILLKAGRACGVRLANGAEIAVTHAVLGACDPRTTLERLLPAGTLSPLMEGRVHNIPVANSNYGQMKVDVALSGKLDMKRHHKWRQDGLDLRLSSHIVGTEAGIEKAFARSAAGLLPHSKDYSLWPVIPSAADPSQAPEGQDTLYLYSAVGPYRPDEGWATLKAQAGQDIVDLASTYYDGLDKLEIARQVLTNEDFAVMAHPTGGNVTHVDMVPGRLGPLRPARGLAGYATPVKGLYIGSAGCHPGGGITGAPGYLSARAILKGLR